MNLGLRSFRPNVFERINGFVQRTQKGGRMYWRSAESLFCGSLGTWKNLWKKLHPASLRWIFFKWTLWILAVFSFGQAVSAVQINGHSLQFCYQIRTSMSLCNFSCLRKRGHSRQEGFLDGVADGFVDFLPSLPFPDFSWGVSVCWPFTLSWNAVFVRAEECTCTGLFILRWEFTVAGVVQSSSYTVMFWLFNEAKRR